MAKIINTNTHNVRDCRAEYFIVGDTVYAVCAEEKTNATQTPLDIMQRLIARQTDNLISERTRCLRPDGGKK